MLNEKIVITIDNVTPYLLDRGFLTTESIMNDGLKIIDVSRKNRNIKVIRNHNQSYLLKQPNTASHESRKTIQREASIYTLAQEDSDFKSFSAIVPRILKFDPRLDLLITEFVTNGKSLNDYIYDTSITELPNILASTLGEVIATYHRTFAKCSNSPQLSFLPRTFPSTLYLSHPGPEILSRLSSANLKLLKLMQQHSELSNLFENLVNNWHVQTLIHGDIRWDNILAFFLNDHNSTVQIKLVDWEFADFGDPAWDIGSVFHDFILFWLYSLRGTANETIEQLLAHAHHPLRDVQSDIRTFWHTYTKVLGINDRESNELLYRSTKYCAVRLLQTVYESSFDETELSNMSIYMVQLSTNILIDAGSAIAHLLGIPCRGYLSL